MSIHLSRGSTGLRSVKREQTASKTFEIVKDTLFVFKDVQTDDSWTVGVAVIGSGAEHSSIFLKLLFICFWLGWVFIAVLSSCRAEATL